MKKTQSAGVSVVIGIVCLIWFFTGGIKSPLTPALTGVSNQEREFTFVVTGDRGLEFQGWYGTYELGGATSQKSIDGVVPSTFTVRGHNAGGTFSKKGKAGRLKVELRCEGKVLKSEETSAEYGGVLVSE